MHILLTGAAGFIGMHTAQRLLARGDTVLGIDNLNDYYAVALKRARLEPLQKHPGFTFEQVDVADREAMARLPHDQAAFERMLGLSRPFGPAGLDHWEKIMFRPTLNISGLTAGFQGAGTKTVIPCEATAKIDMRLVKNQTPEDILAKFRRHAAAMGMGGLEIEKGMQYLPARTAIDHPYCLLVRRALGEGFDQEPVVTPVVGGSNP
ncbi:MAG: peptidase dimerization domain-containing protein, partial [Hydrogenophaga sp.]|uniref:NAD-dependent epimerase/dehydratase family protein n=1 Tax=Hydrogenophaga sp. TaxID=1904254 RepID=UPI00260A3D20